jgi:HSP20 family molecular chaperone IbpA
MSVESKNVRGGMPRLQPLTDVVEREDGVHIFMDMPGVSKDGLQVELESGEMVVSGRSGYPASSNEKFLEVEFGNCEYRRKFTLSDEIDREGIRAVLKNGVLEIFLPKSGAGKSKKIEISSG